MFPLDADAHARAAARLPGPLAERARLAFADYGRLEMPTSKDEAWRYVEVEFDPDDFGLPERPGTALDADGGVARLFDDIAGRAISVDGFTVEAGGSDEVTVVAVGSADESVVDVFGPVPLADRLDACRDAFAFDGVVVHAEAGTQVGRPVVVDVQATQRDGLSLPVVLVRADPESVLSVVIDQRSPNGVPCLVMPRIEVVAGDAARVEVTVVQSWGDATIAVAGHRMRAGRDATLGLAESGLGGRFARLSLDVTLAGPGAGSRILGAYFGDREQTLDYRAFIRHAAPSTTSDMFLKGAVGDRAQSVFSGLIRIEPEGQKTNAHQTNRNLVLSEGAEAHSVPNLEILADDVRCGHGSAVGPLDEEQRYYLMSRGLTRPRADRVQVRGFFEEVLRQFAAEPVVPVLRERVLEKYEGVAQ